MVAMLIADDDDSNILATQRKMLERDERGEVTGGILDFAAHEAGFHLPIAEASALGLTEAAVQELGYVPSQIAVSRDTPGARRNELTDIWYVREVREPVQDEQPPVGWRACPGGWAHGLIVGVGQPCPGGEWEKPARGSGTWPEYLLSGVHDFRTEWSGPPGQRRISALVNKKSAFRRERAQIEAAIAERIAAADGEPADIRDIVGGPDSPLMLDDEGRTLMRLPTRPTPAHLPLIRWPVMENDKVA